LNISAGPGIGHLFKIFIPAKVLVFENFSLKLSYTNLVLVFGPRLILGWYVAGTSQVLKIGIKLVQGWYYLRLILLQVIPAL
jgi:hypothetical protein